MSTFIEQLGQSQYFLTFDEEYRERLFAVQGEIGRAYEFTILDKNRLPVTDPNVFLNFIIQTKTGNTTSVQSVNNNGKFKIILPQKVLYYAGYATYQLTLEEKTGKDSEFRLLGAKQATIYIEPNINFTAPDGENFIFSFEEFRQKMALLDAMLDGQNTVLQEQINARDEMLDIYNQIDLATDVLAKIDEADRLKALLDEMYNDSTVSDLNRKIDTAQSRADLANNRSISNLNSINEMETELLHLQTLASGRIKTAVFGVKSKALTLSGHLGVIRNSTSGQFIEDDTLQVKLPSPSMIDDIWNVYVTTNERDIGFTPSRVSFNYETGWLQIDGGWVIFADYNEYYNKVLDVTVKVMYSNVMTD